MRTACRSLKAALLPRGQRPQGLGNYEVELTHEWLKNWHFVLNVHHRSGIWGVIAPQKTGANYIGGGIRFDF
jgi:hypothetical protein